MKYRKDLSKLPVSKRESFIYLQMGKLEVDGFALIFSNENEVLHIPVGSIGVIQLGPGTSVTQEAVKICAEEKTLLQWVGENSVRIYSAALSSYSLPDHAARQVAYAMDGTQRLRVARNLYRHMFSTEAPKKRSIEQLRGWEGSIVKKAYSDLAKKYNVRWEGRTVSATVKRGIDSINMALEVANSCLYGVSESATVGLGYLPSVGFIHRGNRRSFVFDIADTQKLDFIENVVFMRFKEIESGASVRLIARDYIKETKLTQKLIKVIEESLHYGFSGSNN